jgi:hypothetical protein
MSSYYEKNKEKIKQQRKERYANDAVYREGQLAGSKKWRDENPERMKEHRKTWEHSNPAWIMYHNAKRRARELQIPFNITFKDIVIPTHCPILGFELTSNNRETNPSLDRVIPELGYVVGNIKVISMRANRLKQDATMEELSQIIIYMTDHN